MHVDHQSYIFYEKENKKTQTQQSRNIVSSNKPVRKVLCNSTHLIWLKESSSKCKTYLNHPLLISLCSLKIQTFLCRKFCVECPEKTMSRGLKKQIKDLHGNFVAAKNIIKNNSQNLDLVSCLFIHKYTFSTDMTENLHTHWHTVDKIEYP